jgi:hypothetical protein
MTVTPPIIMKVISNYDHTNKIIIYDDGVIAFTDGSVWTEFYSGGKVRKFEKYKPYSLYEIAAQRYTGETHEVPDGYNCKSPLESLIEHICKTTSITFNRA